MNHREPPALARWLLHHLTSKENNEALSGDLLEVFRTGRSAGWYWYQVITAIAIAWCRNVWRHRAALFFAAVWSALFPAWPLLTNRFMHRLFSLDYSFNWRSLAEPWSTVFILGFSLMDSMLFIGLGIAVYSTMHFLVVRELPLQSVRKGFLWGTVAFALAWISLYAITMRPTVIGELESSGILMPLSCLPYFIGTLTTLWLLASGGKPEQVLEA